jgi:hypothetical protein
MQNSHSTWKNFQKNLISLNLLGDNIDAIKKNMETLIDASKEVGLEVKNSVALVRKRTIPYRPTAAVGEVSANFCE